MKAAEPVKSFNKYYCPGCGRYFGKETEGEKAFEKETACMRCGQKIKWEIKKELKEEQNITEIELMQEEKVPEPDVMDTLCRKFLYYYLSSLGNSMNKG